MQNLSRGCPSAEAGQGLILAVLCSTADHIAELAALIAASAGHWVQRGCSAAEVSRKVGGISHVFVVEADTISNIARGIVQK